MASIINAQEAYLGCWYCWSLIPGRYPGTFQTDKLISPTTHLKFFQHFIILMKTVTNPRLATCSLKDYFHLPKILNYWLSLWDCKIYAFYPHILLDAETWFPNSCYWTVKTFYILLSAPLSRRPHHRISRTRSQGPRREPSWPKSWPRPTSNSRNQNRKRNRYLSTPPPVFPIATCWLPFRRS